MDNLCDIVSCIGPNDHSLIEQFISNVTENILNLNKIYIITQKDVIETYKDKIPSVCFVDETDFPFRKSYIDNLLKLPSRSGWYLQQLLKLYSPFIIKPLFENFLFIDSDIFFHKKISFFKDNKILFNTGVEHWYPYFDHMKKVHPTLSRMKPVSGICHLMPMKKSIVKSLFEMIESYHKDIFWKVFLQFVDYGRPEIPGASEYEILFNYTLLFHPKDCEIVRLDWRNTSRVDKNYGGVYEACHHHMRN